MSAFAVRTGLVEGSHQSQRYLWTDAFAVCNFIELYRRTGDQKYGRRAIELIDQVHSVLGRYREDDVRHGWISGLDDETGRQHPTAGGLRIGKPLKERDAGEPFNEQLEWERDGQYFHYLTKWIHALCAATKLIGEAGSWAVELASAAFEGFARKSQSGQVLGVYWKMSTDCSRALVPATGLHDALDGFLTFREVEHTWACSPANGGAPDLRPAIEKLSALCVQRNWTTQDPLGIGGLLFDACRLCQLTGEECADDVRLLDNITDGCQRGLQRLLAERQLNRPLSYRLPFRELGLAIGLAALPMIAERIGQARMATRTQLRQTIDVLLEHVPLSHGIIQTWLLAQHHESWRAHQDINDVMLATALIPETFLLVR
jgi:hypothetical protein